MKATPMNLVRAMGWTLIGAFAALGFFREFEWRMDTHVRPFSHWHEYESVEPTRDVLFVGQDLWMQSTAVRYRDAFMGFVDRVECVLDREGAERFVSEHAYPARMRRAAVIGEPTTLEYSPELPRRKGRFRWEGNLPREPATCSYIGGAQLITPIGVIREHDVHARRTFRIEERGG